MQKGRAKGASRDLTQSGTCPNNAAAAAGSQWPSKDKAPNWRRKQSDARRKARPPGLLAQRPA